MNSAKDAHTHTQTHTCTQTYIHVYIHTHTHTHIYMMTLHYRGDKKTGLYGSKSKQESLEKQEQRRETQQRITNIQTLTLENAKLKQELATAYQALQASKDAQDEVEKQRLETKDHLRQMESHIVQQKQLQAQEAVSTVRPSRLNRSTHRATRER